MIVEAHHGEHLFTQIDASASRQPKGGIVALCLRWKGQILLPQGIQTWPSVGCFPVINSVSMCHYFGKLYINSRWICKSFQKSICVHGVFVNIIPNLFLSCCILAHPVKAVLFDFLFAIASIFMSAWSFVLYILICGTLKYIHT